MTPNLFRRKIAALFSAWALTLGLTLTPLQSQAQEAPKVKIATNMGDIMALMGDRLYPRVTASGVLVRGLAVPGRTSAAGARCRR